MLVHDRKAFTLIELLVVIAILALLMSILMPVLQKVRDQAQESVCRSNMRQIGLAANLYAHEWDSCIPRGTGGDFTPWFQLFMPHLAEKPTRNDYRNVKMYRCPSYPDKKQTVCYVINGWEFDNDQDMVGREIRRPAKLDRYRNLSSTIYLADNEYGHWRPIITSADGDIHLCDVWSQGHLPTSNSEDRYRGRRIARKRHKNGCNALFLDWHVEAMPAEEMTLNTWRFRKVTY